MKKLSLSLVAIVAILLGVLVSPAKANHSWGDYHWARTSNPFTLRIDDNLSQSWKPILATTVTDWTQSNVLDLISFVSSNVKNCKATAGRVEVCNSKYGNNGWLGIAQIWISGNHITAGITKVNDSYFTKPQYNTVAWKNLVMCQEVGHTLGLDHQDEIFDNDNLNTCMDYTSSPDSNQHPNAHDYEELESIYAHLDATTTLSSSTSGHAGYNVSHDNPSEWGQLARESKGVAVYERDFGNGQKMITHVTRILD